MERSRFPENINIAQSRTRDSFLKISARHTGIEGTQINHNIPVSGCRRILKNTDSIPFKLVAVIRHICPGSGSALFKQRPLFRKNHVDGRFFAEIAFGLMHLKFQCLSRKIRIRATETIGNPTSHSERFHRIFGRGSFPIRHGNHTASHRGTCGTSRIHIDHTRYFSRHECITVGGIAKGHRRICRRGLKHKRGCLVVITAI